MLASHVIRKTFKIVLATFSYIFINFKMFFFLLQYVKALTKDSNQIRSHLSYITNK